MRLKGSSIKPTESELEILQVLWNKHQATVREVHDQIAKIRDCGYTTTLKIMQIMFEKQLVARDNSHKTHIYFANISKEGTQKELVGRMISALFSGSSAQLVLHALGSSKPTESELEDIEALISEMKSK